MQDKGKKGLEGGLGVVERFLGKREDGRDGKERIELLI
jgi:hypothetical protein